jgi:hypothetical protein
LRYAVELYLPRPHGKPLSEALDRAGNVAEQVGLPGKHVRFSRSRVLPGDEVCFLVFEGPSASAVAEVAQQAGIAFERVIEAEFVPGETVGHSEAGEGS